MKTIIGLLLLTSLASCGKRDVLTQVGKGIEVGVNDVGQFVEKVGRTPRTIINLILGTDASTDEELKNLQKEVAEIEKSIEDLKLELNSKLSVLEKYDNDFYQNVTNAIQDLEDTETSLNNIETGLSALDTLVDDFINGYAVKIDPCGDTPNKVDEILLKLYDGTILAVFKDGQYFMAEIGDGNYKTTDKTNCYFTVNNGQVTW